MILLSTIVLLWRKLRTQLKRMIAYRSEANAAKELLDTAHDDINLMCAAWHFEFDEIHLERKLAAGAAGQVWLGTLHDKWKVAIKEMFFSDEISLVEESEIKFLQRVRHKRLVLFLGCGRTNEGYIFTVLELMNGGSFDRLLWDGIAEHCDWKKRLQILVDSAEGMTFLHAVIGSVHRDLKSPNILLDQERGVTRAKIADFGLARLVDQKALAKAARLARMSTSSSNLTREDSVLSSDGEGSDQEDENSDFILDPENVTLMKEEQGDTEIRYASMTGNRGTSAWMAPEMWSAKEDVEEDAEHEYSQSVDVYAFAIIMWEALSFSAPWGGLKVKKIRKKVITGDRPPVSKRNARDAPDGYVDLMKRCWSQKDKRRPTFQTIYKELVSMRVLLEEEKTTRKNIVVDSIEDSFEEEKVASPPKRKRLSSSAPSGLRFWHARQKQITSSDSSTSSTTTTTQVERIKKKD